VRRKSEVDVEKVQTWCETLTTSKDWPIDNEEINKLWKPVEKDLTSEEQISLLNCLVQNSNVFRWLKLISYVLPNLFSEDQNFINLIEIVVDKVKGDMAQGIFIRSLINMGERDPEKGISLYSRIIEVSSDSTIHYSGLILGGASKKRFDKVYKIIKKDLQTEKVSVKVACLKALRVAFEAGEERQFQPEILDILEDMLEIKDPSLQTEVIQGYLDFDRFESRKCEQKLLEIANTGNSLARLTIADRLWFGKLEDQSKEIEILEICSEDNNIRVLESVARVLSRKGQAFLSDSLGIVRRLLKKPSHLYVPNLNYYFKELCKNELDACLSTLEKWKDCDTDPVFQFRISELLRDIELRVATS